MTFALQLTAQFGEVVDFAVVGGPDGAVLIAHRHVSAGGKIDDREAAAAQTDIRAIRASPLPEPEVVRTTMGLHGRHARERLLVPAVDQPAYPAH